MGCVGTLLFLILILAITLPCLRPKMNAADSDVCSYIWVGVAIKKSSKK